MTAVLGSRTLRKEDPALLTGEARFTDDLDVTGALIVRVVRSTAANAMIRNIDVAAARALEGVVTVLTGADLADEWAGPLPCAWPVTDDMIHPDHFPVAVDQVRYVGDAVAVVVAESSRVARDAAEAVVVDYEELPVVADLNGAIADEALVHADAGTNRTYTWELIPDPDAVDAAFASATHTVSERYLQQRLIPMAIEPRALVAIPEPFGGDFTLYASTQVPHFVKIFMAIVCGIPEQKLRVVAPAVGGGFGSKLQVYAEEAICLVLARRLRRPVRWNEERGENTQAIDGGLFDIDLLINVDR